MKKRLPPEPFLPGVHPAMNLGLFPSSGSRTPEMLLCFRQTRTGNKTNLGVNVAIHVLLRCKCGKSTWSNIPVSVGAWVS